MITVSFAMSAGGGIELESQLMRGGVHTAFLRV